MNILEIWKANETRATRTAKNTTYCNILSKLGVTYMRNQPVYIFQPKPKAPHILIFLLFSFL
jgi:hypothetical protein